jgi:hypothetical protein
MAEARNSFIKSKMNKDLDARLVPAGEYRDAQNVSVSKSEGADVGSLENILGNISLTDFGLSATTNLDIIGFFMDVINNRIFVFITNYVDTSADKLSNFAPSAATCSIGLYNITTSTATIIVNGSFLNFSKCSPVLGVNIADNNNLFFTDNRNQPRKINVATALNNTSYYTSEDQISLAKYYPYEPISLNADLVTGITATGVGSGYAIENNLSTTGGTGTGLTVNIISTSGQVTINNPGSGYTNGDTITPVQRSGSGSGVTYTVIVQNITTMQDVVSPHLPNGGTALVNGAVTSSNTIAIDNLSLDQSYINQGAVVTGVGIPANTITTSSIDSTSLSVNISNVVTLANNEPLIFNENPYYNPNWPGDKEFLKDKFVRFAYRFRYDDGEYSLISPFTQSCFIPQQDGYFTSGYTGSVYVSDLEKTYKSTEVEFMQNKVNNIKLLIPTPAESTTWTNATTDLKISEIDIIYKQADQTTLKVVDTLEASSFSSNSSGFIIYEYQSKKPFKTLPTRDLLRVYDQAPVRALTQEITGNRLVFGNFVDKHTPPSAINYNTEAGFKVESSGSDPVEYSQIRKEYQNHTLKQNRTYQVGLVLSDKFGRQSDVILSTVDNNSQSSTLKGSTIFNPYKSGLNQEGSDLASYNVFNISNTFSYPDTTGVGALTNNLQNAVDTWPGDQLKIKFNETISSTFNSTTGTPGLYSATNPLGWYSYKAVVKQTEVDYYNVYYPGFLNGYIDGETVDPLHASLEEPVGHFVLHADNLNKIPKDVTLLGPNQNVFRTARPSFNEDPSYYQFTDTNGNAFQADPYTEEGEQLLKTRDRERDLDSGAQVNNASVELFTRVILTTSSTSGNSYRQYYPGVVPEVVTAIGTGSDLGLFAVGNVTKYPFNAAPVFYNYKQNPFIARVNIFSAKSEGAVEAFGLIGPSVQSSEYIVSVSSINAYGSNYPGTGGSGIPVVFEDNPPGGGQTADADKFKNRGIKITIKVGIAPTPGAAGNNVTHVTITNPGEGWDTLLFPASPSNFLEAKATIKAAGDGNSVFTIKVEKSPTHDNNPGTVRKRLAPNFSVFETAPLESKLDIYWETSTAGKISTLNTNIIANDTTNTLWF